MIVINIQTTDPEFNLAAEEYFFESAKEDICLLWQNSDSIIVGKNQNTLAEINYEEVKKHNIKVVRRMSGGGAVFHDLGNLNYTFITHKSSDENAEALKIDFEKFTAPVIDFMKTLGVEAVLSGRNDLCINGKKISGNAQYIKDNKIMHHGTLLFSANVDRLSSLLTCDEDKIKSKGISSIKNRVTNINEHLKTPISVFEFKNLLSKYISAQTSFLKYEDIHSICSLKAKKYSQWEWNYGYSPKYSFIKKGRFSFGSIELNMDIQNGIINKVKIFGDFFTAEPIENFEKALLGAKHEEKSILELFAKTDINKYFLGVSEQELASFFF